ncbi:hypothetical protein K474DRAFT_1283001 [Panus rudis PR-1116 ss-1]|nr:hypothetical protein K474DRAFT_1283001 [Panus rudis PR-1116 ss-1]
MRTAESWGFLSLSPLHCSVRWRWFYSVSEWRWFTEGWPEARTSLARLLVGGYVCVTVYTRRVPSINSLPILLIHLTPICTLFAMPRSSASSSSSSSNSSPATQPLFSFTPLAPRRGGGKHFPPHKYIAAAAQVVHFNGLAKLPMIARVTIVDYRGDTILDTFVRPTQPVSDYRSAKTGIRPQHLAGAPEFADVQRHVAQLLSGKILVGYAIWDFLSVMGLCHPAIDTRDVALFMPFRKSLKFRSNVQVPLATLVRQLMGHHIGLHGEVAIEEARAALDLFRSSEQVWEDIIKTGSWPCCLPPTAYGNCFT